MRTQSIISTGLALVASTTMSLAQESPQPPQISPPPAPIAVPVASDEPETSLEELLRRALENNPRLQIAQTNLDAASERAKSGRAFPNPTLQLVPGLTGSSAARDEEVVLAQPLDLFGARRARSQVLSADLRRVEAQNRLARRALELDVKNAATLLFAAQEAEKLEQVQAEIAGLFRDAAAKRAALGDVPPVQVQRAELEQLRVQNGLAQASALRLSRRTVLNQLIGAAPNAPLRVAFPLDAAVTALLRVRPDNIAATATDVAAAPATPESPATSSTVGGALVAPDAGVASVSELRPDVVGAQATLEARQAQVRAIGRELLPTVELQARRSAFFGRDGSYALRAVVTVPLFDFGSIKGQRRAAQAEVRAQQATVQLLRQQSEAQLENARIALRTRRETVARYQSQMLPLALDLLRKTQIGYAQGASTYLEVLESQRALRGIQAAYLQALVGVQSGENALDAAINGGALPLDSTLNFSALGVSGNDSP